MNLFQLYSGTVRHRRFTPADNSFCYPLQMWYIDLDDLDDLKKIAWWSPFRFRRTDYLDKTHKPLKQAVIDKVQQTLPTLTIEKVFLLTQIRCLGYIINPISVYYCFDTKGLQSMIAEVTNTPWGEKKIYVLPCDPNKPQQRIQFDKQMHVSPFNPMNMHYHWSSNIPDESLTVHLDCWVKEEKHLDATLNLSLTSSDRMTPWMTWKIAWLIYFQAAKLFFIKSVPFYNHQPKKN